MSAICGIVHLDGRPVDPADLRQMAASSPHRGPDGVSYHVEGNAGFAYLGFHVTPESQGETQPWVDPETGVVFVADARIDNRGELDGHLGDQISRLKPLLQPFPQAAIPDSLYIVAAWKKWGEACVGHLLGDFVFAVWDASRGELFLARDPLGAHSVAWNRNGESFVFASEITAILDRPAVTAPINEDAVARTLAGVGLAPDETYFKSLFHLPPAHCMRIAAGKSKFWRYWTMDPGKRIRYKTEGDYTDHFLELLDEAVACRLRGNGSPGISLSGGHDSVLLAAVASRRLAGTNRPLRSFSYVFDRFGESDERTYIQPVVNELHIDATYINADRMWAFSELSSRPVPQDFLWTNAYSRFPEAVAEAAGHTGCRLLLDGMFGDALFGEPSLFAADLIRRGRLPSLVSLCWHYRDAMDWRQELWQHGLRRLIPRGLRRAYRRQRPLDPRRIAPGLTDDWVRRLQAIKAPVPDPAAGLRLTPGRRARCNRMLRPFWAQGYGATRCIPYNRAGVERLSPYYDRRLVEFAVAVPCEQVSHPGRPRRLQRNAIGRLLPHDIWGRRGKTGFEPLLEEGLLRRERHTVLKPGQRALIVERGWIRDDWLQEQLQSTTAVVGDNYFLSTCLHAELWLQAVLSHPK